MIQDAMERQNQMDYSSVLSLSPKRNCLFHFHPHPHLRRGFSKPLPSITDPTRSAFVSSENLKTSVTVSLENLCHFLTTNSATQRRKGGCDASILLGLLKEFIPINSLFLRVYSKDHYGKHAGTYVLLRWLLR